MYPMTIMKRKKCIPPKKITYLIIPNAHNETKKIIIPKKITHLIIPNAHK